MKNSRVEPILVRWPVKKAGQRESVGCSIFLTRVFCLLFVAMTKSKSHPARGLRHTKIFHQVWKYLLTSISRIAIRHLFIIAFVLTKALVKP